MEAFPPPPVEPSQPATGDSRPPTSGKPRSPGAARRSHGALDVATFEALFRESAGDVHGYLSSLLGDRATAEDITAQAFERLYRARSRLDTRRGTPRAWLFAIARNGALDELRRRKRSGLRQERSSDPGEVMTGGEALECVERRAIVAEALESLPLRDRELVLLKFHGQLSNGELARTMGVSESNVGTRLHRALTRLRERCAEGEQERAA